MTLRVALGIGMGLVHVSALANVAGPMPLTL
jgi:hypothetical protein